MSDKAAVFVLNTNILIYYLNQQLPELVKVQVDEAILSGCAISIITRIEVLGWQGHTAQSLIAARGLLSLCEEVSLNMAVADCCIDLRQRYKIKLPGAVIAATALVSEYSLITRNTDDFSKIEGLVCVNPFLGWIFKMSAGEGWETMTLSDIADITMRQSPDSKFYTENERDLPFFQGCDEFTTRFPNPKLHYTQIKKVALTGSILFSVRAPVGRINIADQPYIIGRGLAAISGTGINRDLLERFIDYQEPFFGQLPKVQLLRRLIQPS